MDAVAHNFCDKFNVKIDMRGVVAIHLLRMLTTEDAAEWAEASARVAGIINEREKVKRVNKSAKHIGSDKG